jgi:hypothetical protein
MTYSAGNPYGRSPREVLTSIDRALTNGTAVTGTIAPSAPAAAPAAPARKVHAAPKGIGVDAPNWQRSTNLSHN